jgi:hypothetical protein
MHNEELHNLYSSPDIIRQIKSRKMRWAGHVAYMREDSKVYRVLVGKPEGKRPLERPRHRWEDGIRMDYIFISNSSEKVSPEVSFHGHNYFFVFGLYNSCDT